MITTRKVIFQHQNKSYSSIEPVEKDLFSQLPFYTRSLILNSNHILHKEEHDLYHLRPTTIILQDLDSLLTLEHVLAIKQHIKLYYHSTILPQPKIYILLNTHDKLNGCQNYYRLLKWADYNLQDIHIIPSYLGHTYDLGIYFLSSPISLVENNIVPAVMMGNSQSLKSLQAVGNCYINNLDSTSFIDILLGKDSILIGPKVIGIKLTKHFLRGIGVQDFILHLIDLLGDQFEGVCLEFFGEGLSQLSLGDRILITSSPYMPFTCFFPIDQQALAVWQNVEHSYLIQQVLNHWMLYTNNLHEDKLYSEVIDIDLTKVASHIIDCKNFCYTNFSSLQEKIKALPLQQEADLCLQIHIQDMTLSKELITALLIAKKAIEHQLYIKNNVQAFFTSSKLMYNSLKELNLIDALEKLGFIIKISPPFHEIDQLSHASNGDDPQHILLMESGIFVNPQLVKAETSIHICASPITLILYALFGIDFFLKNNGTYIQKESDFDIQTICPNEIEIITIFNTLESSEIIKKYIFQNLKKGSKEWHQEPILRIETFNILPIGHPCLKEKKYYEVLVDNYDVEPLQEQNVILVFNNKLDLQTAAIFLNKPSSFILANDYEERAQHILLHAGILTLRSKNILKFDTKHSLQAQINLNCLNPYQKIRISFFDINNLDKPLKISMPVLEATQQDIERFLKGGLRKELIDELVQLNSKIALSI